MIDFTKGPALVHLVVVAERELIPDEDIRGVGWAPRRWGLTLGGVRQFDKPLAPFFAASSLTCATTALALVTPYLSQKSSL